MFDSNGSVAGIVAVDFSVEWYNKQIRAMTLVTIVICILSLVIGLSAALLLIKSSKKRVRTVNEQLNKLSVSIEALMLEVRNMAGDNEANPTDSGETKQYDIDDLDSLTQKIDVMLSDLGTQIDKVHEQAYYDRVTGVMNKECYLSTKNVMDDMAKEGFAEFSILIYSLNALSEINRVYGHEYGDMALSDAAGILASVFGKERVFRTGGEEFTVITETTSISDIQNGFSRVDFQIAAENAREKPYHHTLSLSMGYAVFDPENDHGYMDVFQRADQMRNANRAIDTAEPGSE
ncbi:MAG: diguanylate cyclase [Lachnospiraceae bacterium]|nr:diguanylate cyclase [Lachnospiraceae bacterium]